MPPQGMDFDAAPGDGFQAAHPRRWTPAGIFDTNHEDLKMKVQVTTVTLRALRWCLKTRKTLVVL